MTPEPLPWDRKEFVFKERKHERNSSFDALAASGGGGGGSSTPRWREPYHRPSPRRPPPGPCCHRPVSYHQLYQESNGHVYTPPRSCGGERFWLEEDRRYSGRSRGGFRRSSPYYDPYDGPPHVTSQRSLAVPINSPPPLKDPVYDKHASGYDQKLDRDRERDRHNSLGGSLGWKPRWSRQGSRTPVRPELDESWVDMPDPSTGKETTVRSPVGSPVRLDEELQRKKKPRLGWGQGLAKYEKQKVEVSTNSEGKEQVSETSPKVMGMAGSMSPVTPCSAAYCSSSVGMELRPFSKAPNMVNEMFHFGDSPAFDPKSINGELPIKIDHLPPISTLTSLLTDLLQPEDACSGDSTCTKYTAMDKLQSYKADIAKELEKTECEIDLSENELKSLNGEGGNALSQSSLTLRDNNSPISFPGSPDGSSKVSLNLTRISSAMRVIEERVPQACVPHEHEADVKSSVDDNPQWLTSTRKSVARGKEISNIVVLNSVEPAVVSEDMPEAQLLMPDDFLERVANEIVSRDEHKLEASGSGASSQVDKSSHGKAGDDLIESIMASNRNAAKQASEVFDKTTEHFDMWGSDQILSCRKNDMHIQEKLALNKLQLKFKERVLTLKYRAFQHLWKEDLRLLSVRKQRPKSQKRFELNNRSSQSASQKRRSSIRSRFMLPASNLTLVPTADIVDFTSKLLSDSHIKIFRSNLKMPALILDEKERRCSMFITKNSLVEDPLSLEKERTMINPWTQEEKGVFMEMLAKHGKDFAKISSSLSHKTTADCIEFYYKNHKSESFRDVKKQLYSRKQSKCTNNYLVTSGKKWNGGADVGSLDLLGSVSAVAAHDNSHTRTQHKYAGRSVYSSYNNSKVSRASNVSFEKVNGIELPVHEEETAADDVLAGICGTLSSEAVSSCVTSSVSPPGKVNTMMDLTPDVAQFIEEEDTCSDEGCGELDSVDWTDEEKSIFVRALSMYGKDFASISSCVGSKSKDQCKSFFSKGRKCLGLDMVMQAQCNGNLQISDANGERSDTDDVCAAEMDSAICSTQSCSKMDVDFTQSILTTSFGGCAHAGDTSLHIENDQSSERYELRELNQGEVQGKAVRVEYVLNMEKLESEAEKLQPAKNLEDNLLRCDVAELSGDKESIKVENNCVSSPVEPFTKGEQLKPQTSDSIEQKVTAVHRSSSDVVKSEVDLQTQKIDKEQNNSFNISFAAESKSSTIGTSSYMVSQMNAPTSGLQSSASLSYLTQAPLPNQDTIHSVPLSMLSSDTSFSSEGSRKISPSTISFEAHINKPHQLSASRDLYQHVLSGHPRKTETPITLGGTSSQLNRYFVPNANNEKHNVSEVSTSRPVMFSPRSEDESCPQLRPCSQNTCQESEDQSTHVKLFGQILSNPSPSQKSNSWSQESDSQVHLPKLKKSATTESSMIRKDSSPSIYPSRPGSSGQVEDVSRRSVLSSYQCSFAGMPIYTAKDQRASSTNNVLDFQEAYAQSLSANGRRLSEPQKWSGFDFVSGLPQQGGTAVARLDVNMSGSSRSIMVGGPGVSDPVAAILAASGGGRENGALGGTTDLGGR